MLVVWLDLSSPLQAPQCVLVAIIDVAVRVQIFMDFV